MKQIKFYNTKTFETFTATNKVALAKELYETSFCRVSSKDVYDWCSKCADRVEIVNDVQLHFDRYDLVGFVNELLKHNIIGRTN